MSLGAFFSAMEVILLVLQTYEAWRFMRLGSAATASSAMDVASGAFPHKWAVMILIAVGFGNFLGAGVFGFLVNLPIVGYYEIVTQFTANHAHGAMMGVYGMLAIGFSKFVARYFIPPDRNTERAMKISFWSLNIGLAMMLFIVGGILPIVYLALRMFAARGRYAILPPEAETEESTGASRQPDRICPVERRPCGMPRRAFRPARHGPDYTGSWRLRR